MLALIFSITLAVYSSVWYNQNIRQRPERVGVAPVRPILPAAPPATPAPVLQQPRTPIEKVSVEATKNTSVSPAKSRNVYTSPYVRNIGVRFPLITPPNFAQKHTSFSAYPLPSLSKSADRDIPITPPSPTPLRKLSDVYQAKLEQIYDLEDELAYLEFELDYARKAIEVNENSIKLVHGMAMSTTNNSTQNPTKLLNTPIAPNTAMSRTAINTTANHLINPVKLLSNKAMSTTNNAVQTPAKLVQTPMAKLQSIDKLLRTSTTAMTAMSCSAINATNRHHLVSPVEPLGSKAMSATKNTVQTPVKLVQTPMARLQSIDKLLRTPITAITAIPAMSQTAIDTKPLGRKAESQSILNTMNEALISPIKPLSNRAMSTANNDHPARAESSKIIVDDIPQQRKSIRDRIRLFEQPKPLKMAKETTQAQSNSIRDRISLFENREPIEESRKTVHRKSNSIAERIGLYTLDERKAVQEPLKKNLRINAYLPDRTDLYNIKGNKDVQHPMEQKTRRMSRAIMGYKGIFEPSEVFANEANSDMEIIKADCPLKEPVPRRVVDAKKMVALCRKFVGVKA